MKPPFGGSGGSTPTSVSDLAKPGGVGTSLPGTPALPGMPELPAMPGMPEVPNLPELPSLPDCLPGSCEALWGAVDKGMSEVKGAADKVSEAAGAAKDKAVAAVDETKAKATKAMDDARQAVAENVEMAKKYAELYQNDAKQAWAGLQSVMAQQNGCLLKEAAGLADKAAGAAGGLMDSAVAKAGQAADKAGQAADDAQNFAKDKANALAETAKQTFDSLYPPTKFFEDNGLDKLKECGSIPGRPEVPAALTDAFEQIDKGTDEAIRQGSDMIAQVQQNEIIEKAIYEAERYRDEGMQELAATADKLKSDLANAIPMASSCGGLPIPFDGSPLDPGAMEQYYHKLMNEFEKMGKDAKDKMIDEIANQVPGAPGMPSMPGLSGPSVNSPSVSGPSVGL